MSSIANVRVTGRQPVRPMSRRAVLRVVPAAVQRSGTGVFAGICMVLLAVGQLGLLVLHAQLAQGSYTLHDLEVTSGVLTDREHALTQSLDAQRNPANLALRAAGLGMVPAGSMAFIRLSDGEILGEAQPAKADRPLVVVTSPRPTPVPATPAPTPATTPTPTPTTTPATTAPASGDAGGPPIGAPE
jgi:hypothetical protein